MGRPRWREDPRSIIQSLASYLPVDDPDQAPDRVFQRARVRAEELSAQCITIIEKRKGWLRARLLSLAMRRMRLLAGMREMPKFYIVKLLDLLRSACLEIGQDFVAQGKLDDPRDIFFVPLDALLLSTSDKGTDLRAIVQRERADYNSELARRQIPRCCLARARCFIKASARTGATISLGMAFHPASPRARFGWCATRGSATGIRRDLGLSGHRSRLDSVVPQCRGAYHGVGWHDDARLGRRTGIRHSRRRRSTRSDHAPEDRSGGADGRRGGQNHHRRAVIRYPMNAS